MMLGYDVEDIYEMQAAISIAFQAIKDNDPVENGLAKALDFFDGLWAEGYFD